MASENELTINELKALGSEEKRARAMRFFKTGPGDYAEGDRFLGVTMPEIRRVAKRHQDMDFQAMDALLASPWHEARMCALVALIEQFKKADAAGRTVIFDFFMAHTRRVDNWDLVDLAAPNIVGAYLLDRPRDVLYRLAQSDFLWEQRIAMVSTLAFIRRDQLDDAYALADRLLDHGHDLMHKAVGWMLREAGKHDEPRLVGYLESRRSRMSSTTRNYARERLAKGPSA